jgi:hypothetical protein
MIKYLELALSQEVYEYFEELDQMNWSARGNVLNQYLSNTSIGTTVMPDKTGNYLKYVLSVQYHWPEKISGVHLPYSAVWIIARLLLFVKRFESRFINFLFVLLFF